MKKRILLIVALALAALSVGLVIYLNSPRVVARNAMAGVADDLLSRAELKPLVKTSKKGSLELSATLDTGVMYGSVYGDSYIGEVIQAELGGKLYFGKDSLFFKNAYLELSVPKSHIDFEGSADLYIGKKYAYLESDLVGGNVGMIKGEMTEALKNSELAREMPEELYYELLPAMKKYDGITEGRSTKSILMDYLIELVTSFEKNADYKSETREILLQGERVKCRVITITLDREDLIAVLEILADCAEDERIGALLDENQWLLEPMLNRLGILPEDAASKGLSACLSELLRAGAYGLRCEDWRIEIATPRYSSKLLSWRLFAEDEEVFSLDFGREGIQKSNRLTLFAGGTEIVYEISQKDDAGYAASLTRGEEILFSLAVDKNAETFEAFWRENGALRSLGGVWRESKERTTVTVERFTDPEGSLIDEGFSLELTVTPKDTMPKPLGKKEIRNIFDLTLDDVWEIITKSSDLLEFLL